MQKERDIEEEKNNKKERKKRGREEAIDAGLHVPLPYPLLRRVSIIVNLERFAGAVRAYRGPHVPHVPEPEV